MRSIFALLLLYLLTCNCQVSASNIKSYSISGKDGKTTFPFRLFNNILVVDVAIDGKDSMKFIFDSGCKSTIIIHPKWLDSFNVNYNKKIFFAGLGYKDSIETYRIDGASLSLGNMKGEHVPVYILSRDSMNIDTYLGIDIDGIFGAEIFEKFYVHINYKTHQIELYNKKPEKKINRHYTRLPVSIYKSKGYLNSMILNKSTQLFSAELLLDTGANVAVIIKNKEPEDLKVQPYIEAELGEGLSGTMYSKIGRLSNLFIDTFHIKNTIVSFQETPITIKESYEDALNGNIGNEILYRFDIFYAYPEKAIYLKPGKHYHDPYYFNVSNIILLENRSRNGGYLVKSIASQSPPLIAGLQKGDEIIRIDGYDCHKIPLEDALLLLNKRMGKKISVTFIRNHVKQKITYKLESII